VEANESVGEQTLLLVAEGMRWVRQDGTTYRVDADTIHVRYDSPATATGTSWPFDIGPTSLEADYDLWICGDPEDYYLIPNTIVRGMHSDSDPTAYPSLQHKDTIVANVDLVTDIITYGRQRSLKAEVFRSVTLKELRERKPAEGWRAFDLQCQGTQDSGFSDDYLRKLVEELVKLGPGSRRGGDGVVGRRVETHSKPRTSQFRAIERVDSVILIGPGIWVRDHIAVLQRYHKTWMQYAADVSPVTTEALERLTAGRRLDIFIYVPLKYIGGGVCDPIPGSGRIEYRVSATDYRFRIDGGRLPSRRPTVEWPQPYDVHRDGPEYEYWFEVDHIEPHDCQISDFLIYEKSADTFVQHSVSTFAPSHRRDIVLAEYQR
jgi:hypothetical protein